jgi:hypothetical protein
VNPRTVLWQSAASAVLLLVTILLAAPAATAWMAGIGLLCAIALNALYAHALGARGRSRRRRLGDRLVALYVIVGLGVPVLAGILGAVTGDKPETSVWKFSPGQFAVILLAGAALFVLVLLSSLIDWYYIRPRIDGVVCPPPCRARAQDKGAWKRVTRRWYLHRGLATLAYIAFALTVAIVVMVMLVERDKPTAEVLGGVSGIAGLLLIFAGAYRSELPTVAKWVLSAAFVLGEDLRYLGYGGPQRGYVLHVAVPVVKLVPLDEDGEPTGVPFVERKNSRLAEADLEGRPTVACDGGCVGLNPECLQRRGAASRRVDRKRRRLIL